MKRVFWLAAAFVVASLGLTWAATDTPPAPVRWAGEYEPEQGILVRWPSDNPELLPVYYGLLKAIAADEDIWIAVDDAAEEEAVRALCAGNGVPTNRLVFVYWPMDLLWMRGYGPLFVGTASEETPVEAIVDTVYPYEGFAAEDSVAQLAAFEFHVPLYGSEFALEGGDLLTDGQGTCFTSPRVYTDNPDWSENEVAAFFADYLGCSQLLVIESMAGQTVGIDMFVSVVGAHTVVVSRYEEDAANYQACEDAAAQIASSSAVDGEPYEVVRVGQQDTVGVEDETIVLSYTNVLIANKKVMVPAYNSSLDAEAQATYEALFPDRTVVLVDGTTIITQGGALHCLTAERPDYSQADDDTADDDATDDDHADDDDDDDDCGCGG